MNIYMLVGLPGAGKSYWAKQKANEDPFTIIVSRDSLREMIKGKDKYIFNNIYESTIKKITEDMICQFLFDGFDVIVDETNFNCQRRKEIIDYVENHWEMDIHDINVKKVAVYIKNMDTIENRMLEDRGYGKEDWIRVINGMKNNFEPPEISEGFDEIIEIEGWKK